MYVYMLVENSNYKYSVNITEYKYNMVHLKLEIARKSYMIYLKCIFKYIIFTPLKI